MTAPISSTWTAEQDYIRRRKRHNFNAFFDYFFDDHNSLSVSTLNQWNPIVARLYDTETRITDIGGADLSSFITLNDSDENQLNTSFYLDFLHKLRKKGAEISINTHYTHYDYERGQNLKTDFYDVNENLTNENDFFTNSIQHIDLYSIQADYITPLGTSSKFETGLRFASITSKSHIDQEGFDRNQSGIDPTESGVFDYDEEILAGYTSVDNQWGKWKLKIGLRAEHTKTKGMLNTNAEAKKDDYFKLFPSLSLQYTHSTKHDFHLYYYRRITRPRYNNVNPFQVFQSYNSIIEGNPDLLPSSRHYMAGGYTFDRGYTFELFYRNRTNFYQNMVFPG